MQLVRNIHQGMDGLCRKRSIDPLSPLVKNVIDFLTKLFHDECGYSAINTARSALSCFIFTDTSKPLGTDPIVVRLLKGVFSKQTRFAQE